MKLQGLNITVTIKRRQQLPDDDVGGSVQNIVVLRTGILARFGASRSPLILRAQGIEVKNTFDAILRSPDYVPVDIQIDDMLVPESGQYIGQEFAVTAVQGDSIAENFDDFRKHWFLSLRRWEKARTVQ